MEINIFGEVEPHLNGVTATEIETLFNFWIETFNKNSNTILDEARSKKISIAITELTLIFRNAEKVEQFLEIYKTESKALKELEQWKQM